MNVEELSLTPDGVTSVIRATAPKPRHGEIRSDSKISIEMKRPLIKNNSLATIN